MKPSLSRALQPFVTPFNANWHDKDQLDAAGEGWCLSVVDNQFTQLQRLDEKEMFETDRDAGTHVLAMAEKGSHLHCKALLVLAKTNHN